MYNDPLAASKPKEILTADRKQRPINGVQTAATVAIAIILLAGLITGAILWKGNHLKITTSNTALKTTRVIQFQLTPEWGECPLASGCEENSAVQTLSGPITLLPSLDGIGDLDGFCTNVRGAGEEDYVSQCSWTISFNGNATIPVGTVDLGGTMYFLGGTNPEQQLVTLAVTGGTNNYMDPSGGYLVFAYNIDSFDLPLNMTLTIITVD